MTEFEQKQINGRLDEIIRLLTRIADGVSAKYGERDVAVTRPPSRTQKKK